MRRALFLVSALALLASVVTGSERAVAPVEKERPRERPAAVAPEELPLPDLDKLVRERGTPDVQDLFADRVQLPVPAPVKPAAPSITAAPPPPPPPSAPPLPFRYLGRMNDGAKQAVFLARDEATLTAVAGQTLAGQYAVESIGDTALTLVYVPLGIRQVLPIPAPPQSGGNK